jgi:hypothetical protein
LHGAVDIISIQQPLDTKDTWNQNNMSKLLQT